VYLHIIFGVKKHNDTMGISKDEIQYQNIYSPYYFKSRANKRRNLSPKVKTKWLWRELQDQNKKDSVLRCSWNWGLPIEYGTIQTDWDTAIYIQNTAHRPKVSKMYEITKNSIKEVQKCLLCLYNKGVGW